MTMWLYGEAASWPRCRSIVTPGFALAQGMKLPVSISLETGSPLLATLKLRHHPCRAAALGTWYLKLGERRGTKVGSYPARFALDSITLVPERV